MTPLAINGDTLTDRQRAGMAACAGPEDHVMLFGGSRSGKTFLLVFVILARAMGAPGSRHAIFRYRFNAVKRSIGMDTLPKVLASCFPGLTVRLDKQDWVFYLPNGSEIWLAGLDEKERSEKVLGLEFASLFLNEASQTSWNARNLLLTRLAQNVNNVDGNPLRLKFYYDCNPPGKGHWTHKAFVARRDPDTNMPLARPENYTSLMLNPVHNLANLPAGYMETLDSLPARMKLRFRDGQFADEVPGALWTLETIETWRRVDALPDMVRVVVAVDPSGAGDVDNAANDAIGIVVAGLGVDGNGYLIEDLTMKGGPLTWARVVASAYERHGADRVIAEVNYGGAMVASNIKTVLPLAPFTAVTASRGKAVRAEPIAGLAELGKIRHAGYFADLEDELCSFTTGGYMGSQSPNRADAYVWAFTYLFGELVKPARVVEQQRAPARPRGGWLSL